MTKISDELIIDRCAIQYNNIMISFKFKTPRPVDLKNSSIYRLQKPNKLYCLPFGFHFYDVFRNKIGYTFFFVLLKLRYII